MNIQTKKTILILSISAVMTVSMLGVYADWLEHRPPEKILLDDKVLIVYPFFTEIAYAENSFYAYFDGRCDESCLTRDMNVQRGARYILGLNSYDILFQSFYSIKDIDIDKIPPMLDRYHTIILLHSEYVTQKVYDEITNHPNVIYLYPNALYAEISADYNKNTITLVKGHGYPDGTANGFGWIHENTEEEKDCVQGQWNFRNVTNGIQLDCYPENIIRTDEKLKQFIYDYIESSKKEIISNRYMPDVTLEKLK